METKTKFDKFCIMVAYLALAYIAAQGVRACYNYSEIKEDCVKMYHPENPNT